MKFFRELDIQQKPDIIGTKNTLRGEKTWDRQLKKTPEQNPAHPPSPAGIHVREKYEDWFHSYASYVILDRAIPSIVDGLKPVQRRILYAMREMDDGRFNKVANIIGQAMAYHPHGDAAIGDALVGLGQKGLLIETQGNWGDPVTGDSAAAPRYIEARLSTFAREVAFNPDTTLWQVTYDGRKKEPVDLPMKFPLLLAQGAEGITVGLATKILPHNFVELLEASVRVLKKEPVALLPDFPTGGLADVSGYDGGRRGGRVRCRARIEIADPKTLVIREVPFGVSTDSLMESIVKANDAGKIKIKRVVDNTAENVEVLVELPPGVSPDLTMDALFAFTDAETTISTNACVIRDDKPHFLSVEEVLEENTHHTVELLKRELEIKRDDLENKWHFASLEYLFIVHKIYRKLEDCESWDEVVQTVLHALAPFRKKLRRDVTPEDVVRLAEIRIKRISKYNLEKARQDIEAIEGDLATTRHHLEHLIDYAIAYFESLRDKYSSGRERRTVLRNFETVRATHVAAANQKLYVDRDAGFVGYGLKKNEYVCECSDIDDVIVILADGTMLVTRVSDKAFVGKGVRHVSVWKKGDDRTVYNLVYRDGDSGVAYAKRFTVTAVTRDKPYSVGQGTKGTELLYLTANPNGEAEVVTVHLSGRSRARKKVFDFDFGDLAVKGRGSKGNIVSKYRVLRIVQKQKGSSTLEGVEIFYDAAAGRLNTDSRGRRLGIFENDDRVLAVSRKGTYRLTSYELSNHFDFDADLLVEKFLPEVTVTLVYYSGGKKAFMVKRFQITKQGVGKTFPAIPEEPGSYISYASTTESPQVEVTTARKGKPTITKIVDLAGFPVRNPRAQGNRLPVSGASKVRAAPEEEPATEPLF